MGKDLRTGEDLTNAGILLNVLQILPVKMLTAGLDLAIPSIKKIASESGHIAEVIAKNSDSMERVAKHIPPSLAGNKEKLKSAISEIQRLTPEGQDWTVNADRIMKSFASVKGFNAESLHDIIKHRKTLSVIRQGYADEVVKIENYIAKAKASGQNLEEIARTAHSMRREIGVKYKDMTPDVLRTEIYDRNFLQYKDQLGPSYDFLVKQGLEKGEPLNLIHDTILRKSISANQNLNTLLDILAKELK